MPPKPILDKVTWRRSTRSNQDGNCVEMTVTTWRTSSHSGNGGDCVETSAIVIAAALRKNRH